MGKLQSSARLRWLVAPWREPILAAALIGAASAPVLLVGSADVWRASSQDEVAARAVADVAFDRNGVDVLLESAFEPVTAATASAEIATAVATVGPVEPPRRTIYTLSVLAALGPPPLRQVGPAAEVVAVDDFRDGVVIVDELADTSGGVWVTTWYADRHELSLGDGIAFEAGAIVDEEWNDLVRGGGADSVFRIVGTYEPLWSSDPEASIDPFWNRVPPEVLPRFIPAFNSPNLEMVLTDEATLLDSGLTGVLRWQAPLTSIPSTFDELVDLERRFRQFETQLVGGGPLGEAMADASTVARRRPALTTDFFVTSGSARRAAMLLDAPLAAARGVGGVVGLAAAIAVGVFLVERRRSEFRLLASEGEGALRMGIRTAAQLAAPTSVGVALGVGAALIGPRWLGPARRIEWGALRWPPIIAVAAASLALASLAAGVLGARTLRTVAPATQRSLGRLGLLALVAATMSAWVQVGRTSAADGELDLVVVGLPVLAILLAVTVVLIAAGWVLGRRGVQGRRLPLPLFLTARRLTRGSNGVRFATAALGLGIGLIVFATALTTTLDRTVEVKLATEVGGETAVALVDDLPAGFVPPAPTTVVRIFDTVVTPGDVPTRIVAIDPDTFAAAVSWPEQFGTDVDSVIAAVEDLVDVIPTVALTSEAAPPAGAFGIARALQYRVSNEVASVPAAGERTVTMLASADVIDEFASAASGYDSIAEAAEAGFAFPVDAFRRRLITRAGPEAISAALDDAGVRYRSVVSRRELRNAPALVATRAAFGYLAAIGAVALIAALVALGAFLSARRRLRAVTLVMVRSMGVPPWRSALVSALEVLALLVIAVAAAFAAVPLVVRRLSGLFDPDPARPPEVPVLVSWVPLAAASVLGALGICAVVWWVERRSGQRSVGEVLRDAA